eukprot:EG_transcript_42099
MTQFATSASCFFSSSLRAEMLSAILLISLCSAAPRLLCTGVQVLCPPRNTFLSLHGRRPVSMPPGIYKRPPVLQALIATSCMCSFSLTRLPLPLTSPPWPSL